MTLEELTREFDKSQTWCKSQIDSLWPCIDELKDSIKELRQGQSWKWAVPIVLALLLQGAVFLVKWGEITQQLKQMEKSIDRLYGGPGPGGQIP